jgi:di/tricarboxylate transporter
MEVIRGEGVIYPPVDNVVLSRGDILLTKGTVNDIMRIQREQTAVIAPELGMEGVRMTERNMTLAEVVVMPGSRYIGNTIEEVQFKRRYDVNVIAILRKGRHMHIQEQIHDIPLAVGDTLLVQGGEDAVDRLRKAENLLLLEGIGETVMNTSKAPIAVGVLAGVVILATLNVMPIMVLAVIGAIIMVATHCVPVKDAYKNFDASVLLLIASTISLGHAMQTTQTAQLYGSFIVSLVKDLGPMAVIAALFFLTSLLTQFMSNNATAVLMTHIAVATAVQFNYMPMPFIMAVLFGASACYATPTGYQTNLFVYGPGGYKFTDFAKLGIPLNVLVWILATLLIPLIWPLQQIVR